MEHDRIGFVKTNGPNRIAVRNCQGAKVGYLSSENGRQVLRSIDGRLIARITKFKSNGAESRVGASNSGMYVPPEFE